MLTIENIRDLSKSGFHWESKDWQLADAFEDKGRQWCMESHYTITFNRGPYGGAIILERDHSVWDSKYYGVKICYDEYTNIIYEGQVNIGNIRDRNRFFEWAVEILEAERVKLV
jgi:hypothetical protein